MTCRKYTAREFKDIGILNEVYPHEGFMEKIISMAKELSRKNKDLLRFLKVNINHVPYVQSLENGSELEEDAFHYYEKGDKEKYLESIVKKHGIDNLVLRSSLEDEREGQT